MYFTGLGADPCIGYDPAGNCLGVPDNTPLYSDTGQVIGTVGQSAASSTSWLSSPTNMLIAGGAGLFVLLLMMGGGRGR